jgi:NADH-quinone oxidoreductase subunit G
MGTFQVDGHEYEARPEDNLLHVCLSHGLDIPYFCWHPELGSVGACRQCAVKQYRDANDTHGRIVMGCMTAAAPGVRISISDPEVVAFRASVIEWLMSNHPHDCPVCEEGGECHLQDMTVMTGHTYRRYRFAKRTYRNQNLGPFVKHEMNRCIACYRCVRFYRDYAGGHDLDVHAAHNHVYFGRSEDGVLQSDFSGNLVEVCPTGVFTDKTLSAAYARKWDLKGAPSVCVHCGLGCNTLVNGRLGEVRRTLNRYNGEVNRYFLCDRGRFGYGFVNAATRARTPLRAEDDSARAVSKGAAFEYVATLVKEQKLIGVGSPRASVEANFALRALVGADRFYLGVSDIEYGLLMTVLDTLRQGAAPTASLHEAEESDAALVLGEDVSDTAPRLALALRQMVRNAGKPVAVRQKIPLWQDAAVRSATRGVRSPLFLATSQETRLADVATESACLAPSDIARLGFAVAHAIDPAAPEVAHLSTETLNRARQIAEALQGAKRPLIVSGISSGVDAIVRAAARIAMALRQTGHEARIILTVPECNSLGLALIGGAPLSSAFAALHSEPGCTLVVVENDLFRRADHAVVEAALRSAGHVVVLDHTLTETAHHADLVLPAATYAEGDGTLVSNEGRAQRYFQLLYPREPILDSWRWLRECAIAAGRTDLSWKTLESLLETIARDIPGLGGALQAAPSGRYRKVGNRIRSAPHRYSGRTAVHANQTVHEPKPPRSPNAPFSNSMEGYYGVMPGALYPYFWAPAWNSVQALNKFQDEVAGPLRGGDPGVRLFEAAGTAAPGNGAVEIPGPFSAVPGECLIVPAYRVFGSDELSALAPAIAERIDPRATLTLNPEDAAAFAADDGDLLNVGISGVFQRAFARIRFSQPRGVAALSVGLPGHVPVALPAYGRISRLGNEDSPV